MSTPTTDPLDPILDHYLHLLERWEAADRQVLATGTDDPAALDAAIWARTEALGLVQRYEARLALLSVLMDKNVVKHHPEALDDLAAQSPALLQMGSAIADIETRLGGVA